MIFKQIVQLIVAYQIKENTRIPVTINYDSQSVKCYLLKVNKEAICCQTHFQSKMLIISISSIGAIILEENYKSYLDDSIKELFGGLESFS